MEWTALVTCILVLLGSCYNAASLSLDIGDVEFEQITLNTGESTSIACQAGSMNDTEAVYWLSVRYRRFISKNDILFDYGSEMKNFGISVDNENRIYYLYVYTASEEVNGVYVCYSSTVGSDKEVLWAGEVTVLPGNYFSSAEEASISESQVEPIPPHSLECSVSYIPPMINMINMDEVEMEVRCSWSAFDHPNASPTLFCNGKDLLSKYFIGEMVMARVMLKDIRECFNFTCALKGAIGGQPFKETCSYMQEMQLGFDPITQGVRIDPMYSVIQQGMDAMFVCIASSEAPHGIFKWNVSSRLFDTKDLLSNMEITQSTKSSTMLIKDVQALTDEPVLVTCQLITNNQTKNIMSEALLTIMPKMTEHSDKTSPPEQDRRFGMQTVLILACLVLVLLAITFCFTIYVCRSKRRGNSMATPSDGSKNNNRPNRKMSMYVSMKEMWNHNISRRAKQPIPAGTAAGNQGFPASSQARHPAQSRDLCNWHDGLSVTNRMDVSSLKSNPVICIDDGNYIVPDEAQGGRTSPVVLRGRNPRRTEGYYSSTDVMVGSRELSSARSSQEGLMDRDGYLVPSIVVDQDLEEYVYATSNETGGKPEHSKSASCHELSNYSYASY